MAESVEPVPKVDEKAILLQIEKLESKFRYAPDDLSVITELINLYSKVNRREKAQVACEEGLRQFQSNQLSCRQGLALVEACFNFWKTRYLFCTDTSSSGIRR